MDIRKTIILFFAFGVFQLANCGCVLSLRKNFGSPHPVILQDGKFLVPNVEHGDVRLNPSGVLTVACPGKGRFITIDNETSDIDVVEARCVSDSTFRVDRWNGRFQNITCNGLPWFASKVSTDQCYGQNSLIGFGYEIRGEFYKLYEVCFDSNLLTTLYSVHTLTPASYHIQLEGQRPQFVDQGKFFGKIKINDLYKVKNQKKRLNEILGKDMDTKYITKNQFLSRGHLSPRADFPLNFAQRASFEFSNVAPQWMRTNAGDWAALEDGLRRRIKKYGSELIVYTGTYGVLTLDDENGRPQQIFLRSDENNNGIIPVPLYFFKYVYDSHNRTGAAFVTINSSFYNRSMVEELTFCNNICEDDSNYNWLKWKSTGGSSFCCNHEEFVNEIEFLPKFNVVGQFY